MSMTCRKFRIRVGGYFIEREDTSKAGLGMRVQISGTL